MKRLLHSRFATAILLMLLAVSVTNCSAKLDIKPNRSTVKAKQLPPGQAKKIFGSKSAKRYAPGHKKNS